MPHKRSPTKLASIQRRDINHLISREAYRDLSLQESVNTLTPNQIEQYIINRYGACVTGAPLQYTRGEILSDPRGQGSLQKTIDDEE